MNKKPRNVEKAKAKRKSALAKNCLPEMLRELMEDRKVEQRHIHHATGIPFSTLGDWYQGVVQGQMLDGNILALAKFFNVSIHYLAFGIGDDSPVFGDETPAARYKNGN